MPSSIANPDKDRSIRTLHTQTYKHFTSGASDINSCPETQTLLTEIMMKDQEAGSKHISFRNTTQRSPSPHSMNTEASENNYVSS